jgi:RNA polymerase sigma-70 factor (ECF subfamily)
MNVIQHLRRVGVLRDGASQSDAELLARYILRRDEPAFEALLLRHGPMVWGVCRRVLPCEVDAEDAFQATFLVLARKAASIAPREQVGNWLYGVARTTALKARALSRKRAQRERAAAAADRPVPAPVDADLLVLLDEEVSRLPEKYRLPIVLCELEGRTLREVADALGWPLGTVAGRLSRARALLAQRLAGRGVAQPGRLPAAPALPVTLVEITLRSVGLEAVAGPVRILVEGVLTTMLLTKLKNTALVMLALVLLAGAIGLALPAASGQFGGSSSGGFAGGPDTAGPPTREQALQGTWKAVAARWDEKFDRIPALRFPKLVIEGSEVKWREGEFRLTLPAGAGGKQLDLKATTDGIGVRTGETLHLVYALEGDTLRIAYREQGDGRPATLDPAPGSGCVLLELKRVVSDRPFRTSGTTGGSGGASMGTTGGSSGGPAAPGQGGDPRGPDTLVVRLTKAPASDVAAVLRQVFPDPNIRVVFDERTNALVISCDEKHLAKMRDLIEKLDTPAANSSGGTGSGTGRPGSPFRVETDKPEGAVFRLKHANAAEAAHTLKELFGVGKVSIIVEPTSNSLIIRTEPEHMATIQSLIEKVLDKPGPGPGPNPSNR